MSSSEEDGTDREEPPPRQNLQAALQLLRGQPHRGTEGRSGENEEENDIQSTNLVATYTDNCFTGIAEKYRMPYCNLVPFQPSVEDMTQVVFVQNHRPIFSPTIMQCLVSF